MINRPRPLPIHPFLFAMYPVVFLFSRNRDQLSYSDLTIPTLSVLLLASLVFALAGFLRDLHRAAVLASVVMITLFAWGPAYELIQGAEWLPTPWRQQRYLLAVFALVLMTSVWLVARSRRSLADLSRVLNVVAVTMLALNVARVGAWEFQHRAGPPTEIEQGASATAQAAHRDIYYIVLDAYAHEDVLRDRFDVRGETLADGLRARGFVLPPISFANYGLTFLSLASALNMRYIDDIPPEETSWHRLNREIEDNLVVRFLRDQGYKTVHFRSGIGFTNRNRNADVTYKGGRLDELSTVLLQRSLAAPFATRWIASDHRATVLNVLNRLPEVAAIDDATFTFAHVLCPHQPFTFAADGSEIPRPIVDVDAAYLEQVAFVRRHMLDIVDRLLASQPAPIIIIQSDHGSSASVNWGVGDDDWQPDPILITERMPILNALFLPERDATALFGDTSSPVNTFRILFDTYFGHAQSPLPDRSYFSNYLRPYDFTDVTNVVQTSLANTDVVRTSPASTDTP